MQTKIRTFDFKMEGEDRVKLHEMLDQILDEGYLTNHTFVQKAESFFSVKTSSKFAVALNSGSSALLCGLLAIKESVQAHKTKVILPSNTFIACWYAVIDAGFEPILVDYDSSYLGLEINRVRELVALGDIAAVLLVHIGSIIDPQIEALVLLCQEHNVFILEDAAHAFGSHLNGKKAGMFGDLCAYSFHLTKVITSGEGGMLTTNNLDFYKKIISIRQFGKSEEDPHYFLRKGGNFKMSEFQAAFLVADLNRSEERIARRKEIAQIYFDRLKNLSLHFLKPDSRSESSYYKVMALLPRNTRESLYKELQKNNISMPNGVYYYPLHKQPVVKSAQQLFPNTDYFSNHHICLPCYPELTNDQVEYIIECFNRCESAGLV